MRRTLVAIACYFTLIHGAVSAWAPVHLLMMQAAGSEAAFLICHGAADPAAPDEGSGTGGAVQVQCALCAVAAPSALAAPELRVLDDVSFAGGVSIVRTECAAPPGFSPRAGSARAPPFLA